MKLVQRVLQATRDLYLASLKITQLAAAHSHAEP